MLSNNFKLPPIMSRVNRINTDIAFILVFIIYFFLIFQNIIAAFLFEYNRNISYYVLAFKELLIALSIFFYYMVSILSNGKIKKVELFLIVYFLFLCFLCVLYGKWYLFSIRQILLIPFILMFSFFVQKRVTFDRLFSCTILVLSVIAVTGYIDIFFYSEDEWLIRIFNVDNIPKIKGFTKWASGLYNMPTNFYSFDFYNFLGRSVRRAVSIVFDPTLLGQLMVLPSFYFLLRKRYIKFILFFLCLLMSLSKGGIVGLALAILFLKYQEIVSINKKIIYLFFSIISFGVLLWLFYYIEVQSVINHIQGFSDNFYNFLYFPFGRGVGTSGNFAILSSMEVELIQEGESYMGAMVGQLGLIVFIPFLYYMKLIYQFKAHNVKEKAVKYSMLSMLSASFFSESAISFTGSFFLILLSGYFIGKRNTYECEKNTLCHNSTI